MYAAGTAVATAPLPAASSSLGVLNLILGLPQLVPGMPLEGGRVCGRWRGRGPTTATGRAARPPGRADDRLGVLGVGIAVALANLATEGLIVIALGWLLTTGARTLERRLALEQLLRGVTVRQAMERDPPLWGRTYLDTFADRFDGPDAVTAMPVVDDDRVVGMIGERRLRGWDDAGSAPPARPTSWRSRRRCRCSRPTIRCGRRSTR